jgi:hypothetical protein
MFAWKRLSDNQIVQGQSAATAEALFENSGFGAVAVDQPIKGLLAVPVAEAADGTLVPAPSGVVKVIVSMPVLVPADELDRFNEASLETMNYEITEGSWIAGAIERSSPAMIRKEDLEGELKAIGNADASFFDQVDIDDLLATYDDRG